MMNILFLSDFFYTFYTTLIFYLNNKGVPSTIHFALFEEEMNLSDNEHVFCLTLPEKYSCVTKLNQEFLLEYIKKNDIRIVFFPQISGVSSFIKRIKSIDSKIVCLFLLHSRPNLVIADKKEQFKNITFNEIVDHKTLLAWLCPNVYLYILTILWRRWSIAQYNSFDKIVVLSESYIKEYEDVMRKSDTLKKIVSIANPLIEYESHYSIAEKKKQIVYVGALSEVKAVNRLLYVWNKIYREIPEWNLIIVGDGPTRQKNEELAKNLSLERIEFLGFQKSIPIIDKSSILCLTSNIEGLPTVFMEAMTLGVVPIGFDSFSAIYDMIDNWENGVIVPAFDLDKYAEMLIQLVRNDNKRFEMARLAQIKVRQYHINIIGEKWLDLFKQLDLL